MQRFAWRRTRVLALAVLAPALGACSSQLNLSDLTLRKPQLRTEWLTVSAANKEPLTPQSISQDDLVGPGGQCASAVATRSEEEGGAPEAPAPVQGGISLQMTECEVVQRAGAPDNVEFGTNERGERMVVMTYLRGTRPGIYRFAAGRLASIERGPEPAAPARPQRAAPKGAKKSGA